MFCWAFWLAMFHIWRDYDSEKYKELEKKFSLEEQKCKDNIEYLIRSGKKRDEELTSYKEKFKICWNFRCWTQVFYLWQTGVETGYIVLYDEHAKTYWLQWEQEFISDDYFGPSMILEDKYFDIDRKTLINNLIK